MLRHCILAFAVSFSAVVVAVEPSSGQVVPARMLVKIGDQLPGAPGRTCSALNDPYTNGLGKVGFTGNSTDGVTTVSFVWYDTGVVWLNTDSVNPPLTGTEGTMDVSNSGGFIYSPTASGGLDAVWTQAGALLAETDFIASLNMYSSFNSRPRMTPNGAAYWMGGITATQGGATSNRALLYAADPSNPNIQALLIGGGTYGGLVITMTASNFAYDISDNETHRIHVLSATGATTADSFVHLSSNDSVLAREGSPVPGFPGENYAAFRIPAVNNGGHWAIAADTSAATTADEVVVYDSAVILREGQVIDGSTLSGAVNAISLNNRGRLALIFNGAPEVLLAGPAANFAAQARTLLNVGDQIDIDGDTVCDFVVSDFNASQAVAPGLDTAEDGMVWVNVDLTPCAGGTAIEAIIGVRDHCPADFNNSGTVSSQDIFDFLAAFFANDASADFNSSGSVSSQDIFDFLAAFFTACP